MRNCIMRSFSLRRCLQCAARLRLQSLAQRPHGGRGVFGAAAAASAVARPGTGGREAGMEGGCAPPCLGGAAESCGGCFLYAVYTAWT